ncbi:hypothetical protein GWK47_040214 [Chionoecetes opilio]|uniref:Uncharacterized protein n=1 Tax=Chionoecetes opilio TaxID=41210 RepID=A0A8J5D103_CHIOP|nr:hypothetical protein GWK47_040214 [Chionoecetes opilio]
MAAATAARHAQPPKCGFWAARTEPLLGKQLPKKRQLLRAFFPLRPLSQRKSVKEAASLVTAEVAVVWEKARIPTQKKSRCVERILRLYAYETWIDPRSGALKLTSRIAEFSHWR